MPGGQLARHLQRVHQIWLGRLAAGLLHRQPGAIRLIRPATRTMKNSSSALAKMDTNLTRSSSGSDSVLGQLQHSLGEPEPAVLPVQVPVGRELPHDGLGCRPLLLSLRLGLGGDRRAQAVPT